jgi:hypothetical protein
VVLVLIGLMGAFTAGSCGKVSTSIYVFVLVFAVPVCVACQVAMVVSGSIGRLLQRLLLSMFGIRKEDDALLPHTDTDTASRGTRSLG